MKALNTFKCISLDKTIVLKHRPTFKQLHNMISTNCAWADRLSVVTQPRDISAAAWPAAALSCTILRRTVSWNSWERKSKLQRTLAKIGSIFFAIWEWKANHWSLTWIISYYDTLRIDLGVAGTFKLYVVPRYTQANVNCDISNLNQIYQSHSSSHRTMRWETKLLICSLWALITIKNSPWHLSQNWGPSSPIKNVISTSN